MSAINRPMSQMRKLETKEAVFRARKRILKYLVLGFLKQEGLMHTAGTLVTEAALTNEYEVCDNIDLDIILQVKTERDPYGSPVTLCQDNIGGPLGPLCITTRPVDFLRILKDNSHMYRHRNVNRHRTWNLS